MNGWYAIISIFAIVIGPIMAVQVQKALERHTEKKNRQEGIFKTLMATRAAGLSPDHVRALNLIELEFRGQNDILEAWREYLDHLGENPTEERFPAWQEKRSDLLVNLLDVMGKTLGYSFDKVSLRKGAYFPRGHDHWQTANQIIRDQLVRVLSGAVPLKVATVAADPTMQPQVESAQALFRKILSGEQPISIRIIDTEGDSAPG